MISSKLSNRFPYERQRIQRIPSRFNSTQPAGGFGQEKELNFRLGGQSQLYLQTGVDRQMIFALQPAVCRELTHRPLDQAKMAEAVLTWASENRCLPSRWFESSMDARLVPPTVIRFKGCPLISLQPFFTRIGLDRQKPHFIAADDPRAEW
ncbi:MAG: hypothetical protein N3D16_02010 [Anaerolineales bacterium]|nr:hypothetical protein [Anaerolineales bacterium]